MSYYQQAIISSAVSVIIINDITLLINYNYSLIKNVLSTIDKLKTAAEILHH